jgi:hypothetical protein
MARKGEGRHGGSRSATIGVALKDLIEAVADKVFERVERRLPAREHLKEIERQIARLSRRIEASDGRVRVRRVGRPRSDRKCKVAGCELPHVAQGFCSKHYQAWRRKSMRAAAKSASRARS